MRLPITATVLILLITGPLQSQENAGAHPKPMNHSSPAPNLPAPTWEPPPGAVPGSTKHPGKLTSRQEHALPDTAFAFPNIRKEPLTDAGHVRSALARFGEVKNVTDEDRDLAFANIKKAGEFFGVHLREKDWRPMAQRSGTEP
ncbi:MAG: DUF6582 domain-containing protein [Terriglobales bacterium]|jgi:hypothetical protein